MSAVLDGVFQVGVLVNMQQNKGSMFCGVLGLFQQVSTHCSDETFPYNDTHSSCM